MSSSFSTVNSQDSYDHLLFKVLNLTRESPISKALARDGWDRDPYSLISFCDDDLASLRYERRTVQPEGDIKESHSTGGSCSPSTVLEEVPLYERKLLEILREYAHWRDFSGQTEEPKIGGDFFSISSESFDRFRLKSWKSLQERARYSIALSPVTPTNGNEPNQEVTSSERLTVTHGTQSCPSPVSNSYNNIMAVAATTPPPFKRDIDAFPVLKNDKYHDVWHNTVRKTARSQNISDVIDVNYTSKTSKEEKIFDEKLLYFYTVLTKKVQTVQGRAILRRYRKTHDARAAYHDLLLYHEQLKPLQLHLKLNLNTCPTRSAHENNEHTGVVNSVPHNDTSSPDSETAEEVATRHSLSPLSRLSRFSTNGRKVLQALSESAKQVVSNNSSRLSLLSTTIRRRVTSKLRFDISDTSDTITIVFHSVNDHVIDPPNEAPTEVPSSEGCLSTDMTTHDGQYQSISEASAPCGVRETLSEEYPSPFFKYKETNSALIVKNELDSVKTTLGTTAWRQICQAAHANCYFRTSITSLIHGRAREISLHKVKDCRHALLTSRKPRDPSNHDYGPTPAIFGPNPPAPTGIQPFSCISLPATIVASGFSAPHNVSAVSTTVTDPTMYQYC